MQAAPPPIYGLLVDSVLKLATSGFPLTKAFSTVAGATPPFGLGSTYVAVACRESERQRARKRFMLGRNSNSSSAIVERSIKTGSESRSTCAGIFLRLESLFTTLSI